jgi:hypothetical protein
MAVTYNKLHCTEVRDTYVIGPDHGISVIEASEHQDSG